MHSIGRQLDDHKGVGPGFDAVRIGLAFLILYIHCSLLNPDPALAAAPAFPFAPFARWAVDFAALPMFFALSGFLVAASVERLPHGQFLTNRALRIFPALGVEITLSALILGPLLTSFTLGAYFSDPAFFKYFLNILGSIHYQLPGMFLSNPQEGIVNGALWTVPHELTCYALLTTLVLCGVYRRRWLLLAATVGLFSASIVVFLAPLVGLRLPMQDALTYVFVTRGAARLVPLFLVGLLLYRFREKIPYRGEIAALAALVYIALSQFGSPEWLANPLFSAATAPLLGYVVVYLGLSPQLEFRILKGRDYSYGVYLYGYPLQQTLIQLFPNVWTLATFFAASVAASLAMAAFSWNVIEKPILRLRRRWSVAAQIHVDPKAEEPVPAPRLAPATT